MAYLILGFGALYSVYWLLTFLFSLRSKGERSLVIPVLFLLVFGGVGAFGFAKLSEAKSNPDKLTFDMYKKLALDMSPEDVIKSLDPLAPVDMKSLNKDQRKGYELSTNKIKMPPEVMTRLGSGEYDAPRKEAYISFSVEGPSGKINARPKPQKKEKDQKDLPDVYDVDLGNPSTKSMNGVVGLKLRFFQEDADATREVKKVAAEKLKALKEENKTKKEIAEATEHLIVPSLKGTKEVVIEEGVDWNYEAEMPQGSIAKIVCEKIQQKSSGDFVCEYKYQEEYDKCANACKSNESWVDYYMSVAKETCDAQKKAPADCVQNACIDECVLLEVESFDNRFNIKVNPESKEYMGILGNAWSAQLDSGPNEAFKVRETTGGTNIAFRGGADAARLDFWEENDILLDDDFLTNRRLLVAGYVNGKLVAVGQSGIEVPEGQETLKYVAK